MFEKPFLFLSVIVSVTAVVGLFYLIGVLFFSRVEERKTPAMVLVAPSPKIWVSKIITVCNEPWHQRNIELEKYMSSLGVEIFDRISSQDPRFIKEEACLRCDCPSGEILYLQVDKEALSDLVGFVESGSPSLK